MSVNFEVSLKAFRLSNNDIVLNFKPSTMKNHEPLPKISNYESNDKLSLPNLNLSNSNNVPIFNPADLLPTDDFNEEPGLFIDSTPLERVYDYLTRPSAEEEINPTPTAKSDDKFPHLSAKLNILKDDIDMLKKKIELIEEWRLNLEYDLSKQHQTNLEEIGQYFMAIEQRIEDALSQYDADKLGMIDYALESAGGKVVSTPDTTPYPTSVAWDFGYFRLFTPSPASQVIQAGNLPGQCFAFHGQTGRIRIRLAEKIRITSVTLEHSPFRLLSDVTSCPRNFSVLGIEQPENETGIVLGHFVFKNSTALQNFKMDNSTGIYQYVELFVVDNYGKEEYTCVYRFRVHGIAYSENVTDVTKEME